MLNDDEMPRGMLRLTKHYSGVPNSYMLTYELLGVKRNVSFYWHPDLSVSFLEMCRDFRQYLVRIVKEDVKKAIKLELEKLNE